MINKALGVIECFGLIEAFKILEVVSKNMDLEFLGAKKMSGGYIALGVTGELSNVLTAVENAKCMNGDRIRSAQAFPAPSEQMIKYITTSKI